MKPKDLLAYLGERFPTVNAALFAVLFLTVYSVATFFSSPSGLPFGWREGLGMVATISFFFRLRVFDEIKDYRQDAVNHPHRVLQSGRVNLKQLVRLSLAGVVPELAWSAVMGLPTGICWLLAVAYSLLMRYEFFAGDYLKQRLVLYALSHLLIMPFIIGWIWSAYDPGHGPNPFLVLALLSLLGGFSFELARKIHAPEAERAGIDSYSKSLGYAGAIATVLLVLLAGVAVQCYLLFLLRAGALPFAVIGLLYGLTGITYGLSLRRPRQKILRRAELLVSLFMAASYLSIIAEVNF